MSSKSSELPNGPSDIADVADVAGYMIEMLTVMANMAHISNLHNSSVMLAAASQLIRQECQLQTNGPPVFQDTEIPSWPFPMPDNQNQPPGSSE